jgi:hypothetical protein
MFSSYSLLNAASIYYIERKNALSFFVRVGVFPLSWTACPVISAIFSSDKPFDLASFTVPGHCKRFNGSELGGGDGAFGGSSAFMGSSTLIGDGWG